MPYGLRMITIGCFIGALFLPIAFIPGGGYSINGESVSFTEFWRRGGGPLFVAIGILLPVIGYGILKRRRWSRYWFAGFLIITAAYSLTFCPQWNDVLGLLYAGFLIWYLFWRHTVCAYFEHGA